MSNLGVLALLEATSITGTAKAVLEVAYEARAEGSSQRGVDLSVAIFARGEGRVENSLTRAMETSHVPYFLIREQGRFDGSVLPQIRDLVRRSTAEVIWTNSVKSHFLVHKSGVRKDLKWAAFHHGYTATDFKMQLYNQLDRVSLRKADRVLTVCKPFAEQMVSRGVSPSRVRVQHVPIRPFVIMPEAAARLRREFSLHAEAKVILSVGRLSREKGHRDLVQAFAQLRGELPQEQLILMLVGDGPERKKLERQTENLGCGRYVTFAGQRDDAKCFYGIATAFALPSYTEGTPNVLLEAMAAGVSVVATAVGGVPELAADQENALLVAAGQPGELASALRKLVQSHALRNELAKRASDVVAAHSPRSYFVSMRDIFLDMAGE